MIVTERDRIILEHIISYCEDIQAAVKRFGDDYKSFCNDKEYRNACAMCILQIGELCGKLSDEFKIEYSQMPWKEIKGMRNVVVHKYGSISIEATCETIEKDIPDLNDYCTTILKKNGFIESDEKVNQVDVEGKE
ncbi:MAG: DUF86 domain-containing protein [Lachnospiraceae bacterium]|nr:DUF86 domain-containing protein [Lachnospiraceae bacterium]